MTGRNKENRKDRLDRTDKQTERLSHVGQCCGVKKKTLYENFPSSILFTIRVRPVHYLRANVKHESGPSGSEACLTGLISVSGTCASSLYCFSTELTTEARTNHEYYGLEGSEGGREVGE
jgi:hypothetical protein